MSPSPSSEQPTGKLLIFTAPSGAGKTTIVRHLLKEFDELAFSVSATNREMRPGEENGVHYYFLSDAEFRAKVDAGEFVEHEEVYPGRYYGTLRSEIERLWAQGKMVVFDIEVKGATRLKELYPEESVAVFIDPGDQDILFARLRNRSTETLEQLATRMDRAAMELEYRNNFDLVLINDDLQVALVQAEEIVLDVLTR